MTDRALRLTVGITTRNRPESLRRCIDSLCCLEHIALEILIFDDASEVPAAETLKSHQHVRVIRDERGLGNIVGRNTLMKAARAEMVLLLDDDAALLDGAGVERAMRIIESDRQVGAVAFAQANADGTPWPEEMQPGPGQVSRYVPAFIGFAHLLNRAVFIDLGGYRESFVFYGEEKEYCLRLLDRGTTSCICQMRWWCTRRMPPAEHRNGICDTSLATIACTRSTTNLCGVRCGWYRLDCSCIFECDRGGALLIRAGSDGSFLR